MALSRVCNLSALTKLVIGRLNLEATINPDVDLGIDERDVILNKFERMTGITVHIMIAVGSSAV